MKLQFAIMRRRMIMLTMILRRTSLRNPVGETRAVSASTDFSARIAPTASASYYGHSNFAHFEMSKRGWCPLMGIRRPYHHSPSARGQDHRPFLPPTHSPPWRSQLLMTIRWRCAHPSRLSLGSCSPYYSTPRAPISALLRVQHAELKTPARIGSWRSRTAVWPDW